ncbi:hypothetical protein [Pseudoalteromonas sp. S558]|uniref:hypothetical protein n=1 Tax=Pseudoalteromonas sp. S558 TaxID=2066515 RepID=UPI001487410F|nr:hypothetical protein [Pseudoalteromonas sp. S558]
MMDKLDRIALLNTEMLAVLTLLTNEENYTQLKHQLLDTVLHRLLDNSESIHNELIS